MVVSDYVRWMGIAAWTCGADIPRLTRGLCLVPGTSPRHISIQSVGGTVDALVAIEREFTGIQWLLGGSPHDETTLEYVRNQDLCIIQPADLDPTFAVVDFREDVPLHLNSDTQHAIYSPEGSFAIARQLSSTSQGTALPSHIPPWELAEPLGLLALAVRELLSHATVRRLAAEYVRRLARSYPPVAYGRLAYSVDSSKNADGRAGAASSTVTITLHAAADDPIFTHQLLQQLVDRAQEFAIVFGSTVDCHAVFATISLQDVFPATVHEPDAIGTPVILYRIPLAADLLPTWRSPSFCRDVICDETPGDSRSALVLHRDNESGIITARPFVCGESLLDRRVRFGGYIDTARVIAEEQCERRAADTSCLAAAAEPELIWESLALWGPWLNAAVTNTAGTQAITHHAAGGRVTEIDTEKAEQLRPGSGNFRTPSTVHSVHPNHVSVAKNSITRPLLTLRVDTQAPLGSVLHDVCDILDGLGVWSELDFPIALEPLCGEAQAGATEKYELLAQSVRKGTIRGEVLGHDLPDQRCRHHEGSGLSDSVLPCLWPRALGARRWAVTDEALSLAVVRRAISACSLEDVSWIGVRHSRVSAGGQHCISVAVALASAAREGALAPLDTDSQFASVSRELTSAITAACARYFPGLAITCEVVNARNLSIPSTRAWVTAGGYHPVFGLLPAYIQLERNGGESSR